MFKKITGLMLVLAFVFCAFGTVAAAAGDRAFSILSEGEEPTDPPSPEPTLHPSDPTDTPAPTDTPEPTDTPKPTEQVPTNAPLCILTSSLKKAKVGVEYRQQIEANYGDAVFEIYNYPGGSNHFDETGLKLSRDGVISGKPKAAGSFKFYILARSDSAGASVYERFTLTVEGGDSTSAPTATPSPAPAPTGSTATAQPTSAVQTYSPTAAPTQQGNYIAYPLWQSAADTVQYTSPGSYIDLKLVEGVSTYLNFSDFFGNLPAGLEFINDIGADRSCSLRGPVQEAGTFEFALNFTIRGGSKLMLNFRIVSNGQEATPEPVGFPEPHELLPFSALETPAALLPEAIEPKSDRKEDEAV